METGNREALRDSCGDGLVDAPEPFCGLVERDGQLVEAYFRGGYIPQYLVWLAENPQPALTKLVLEQSSMFDFAPMVQLLAGVDAPALKTLEFGGPAGAGARFLFLKSLPAAVVANLEHLSIQARFTSDVLAPLTAATGLKTLTLQPEPKVDAIDLAALAPILGVLEQLAEVHLIGTFETDAVQALTDALPDRVAVRVTGLDAPPPPPKRADPEPEPEVREGGAPFEGDFTGRSNARVEVLSVRTLDTPESVDAAVAELLVARFGEHADERTIAGVFALTDDGEFRSYTCKVVKTGEPLEIVAAHFGDTFVGIGVRDGRMVARLDDTYLAPVSE